MSSTWAYVVRDSAEPLAVAYDRLLADSVPLRRADIAVHYVRSGVVVMLSTKLHEFLRQGIAETFIDSFRDAGWGAGVDAGSEWARVSLHHPTGLTRL